MCNATKPDLVCHLESFKFCSRIQKRGENSVNHAISFKDLP